MGSVGMAAPIPICPSPKPGREVKLIERGVKKDNSKHKLVEFKESGINNEQNQRKCIQKEVALFYYKPYICSNEYTTKDVKKGYIFLCYHETKNKTIPGPFQWLKALHMKIQRLQLPKPALPASE